MLFRRLRWLSFCVLLAALPVSADTLWLTNNDIIRGEVKEMTDGKLHFTTPWGGTVQVDLRYVRALETEQLLWVRMKGQNTFRLMKFDQKGGKTWMLDNQGNETELDDKQKLARLLNDDPGEEQWLLSGHFNVGFDTERGDEDEFRTSGQVNIQDRVNRNIINWKTYYSREDGHTNDREFKISYDYNRFMDEHWYLLGNSLWQYDNSESPRETVAGGGGMGYQFWDRPDGALKMDIALNSLWENYPNDSNEQHMALRWGVNYSQKIWDNLSFHHDWVLFRRLGGKKQWLLDTTTGLRLSITDNLWFNLQLDFDYDNKPAEDSYRSDHSFSFGLGYGW